MYVVFSFCEDGGFSWRVRNGKKIHTVQNVGVSLVGMFRKSEKRFSDHKDFLSTPIKSKKMSNDDVVDSPRRSFPLLYVVRVFQFCHSNHKNNVTSQENHQNQRTKRQRESSSFLFIFHVSILSLKSQEQRNITRELLENQRDEISNANARTQVLVASKKSAERKRQRQRLIRKFSDRSLGEVLRRTKVIYVEEGSLWGTTEHVGVIVSTSISHHDKEYKFLKIQTELLSVQEHELKCCPGNQSDCLLLRRKMVSR